MPKAKSLPENDISILWTKLLSNINSVPTVTLLKQWANPVKISPEETVLSIKTELFLNRISSGNKKDLIVEAIDKLFEQKNSNLIIRLPMKEDEIIKPAAIKAPPPAPQPKPPVEEITEEELNESKELLENPDSSNQDVPAEKVTYSEHSDQINMVVDLFEGKLIE